MNTKTYEPKPGESIHTACRAAAAMAQGGDCQVTFDFNGVSVTATPSSSPAELIRYYDEECTRRHEEYVASPEYKASKEADARREAERKEKVAAILATAPEHMTLRDLEGWRKACEANSDPYGSAVMTYAERWARMMEARMAQGRALSEVAEECSHLANEEGITGFMYGAAVSTLAAVWIHGEALRAWRKQN